MGSSLIVWGRKSSCNVQKVLWTLAELGLPYRYEPFGGIHGGTDAPAYRALNPNGLVPTLQDGSLTVWESHAIARYLAAAYGPASLWRNDPRERAIVDQWTDWTATSFQPAWINLFWLVVRTPKAQHNLAAIAEAYRRSRAAMGILDANLAQRPYVAGPGISYADIVAGVSLYRWFTMEIDRPAMPHVEAWYALLQQRQAFRDVVMVSYADLVGRLAF